MHLPELVSDLAVILLTGGVITVIFKKLNLPLVRTMRGRTLEIDADEPFWMQMDTGFFRSQYLHCNHCHIHIESRSGRIEDEADEFPACDFH